MKTEDKVSIIMPSYNSENEIVESINSVLNQTFDNWELLIIDDASTDNTINMIEPFLRDNRIKLMVNKKNKGVSYSRNLGIDKATGEFIAFLDSDDLWTSNKLERQIDFMNSKNVFFSYTGVSYITSTDRKINYIYNVPLVRSFSKLKRNNTIATSSVIIKACILDNVRFISGDFHEDFLFWLMLLNETKVFAYGVNEPLLIYRFSKKSKSSNKLKSYKMTYHVFKKLGEGRVVSSLYTISHLVKASIKYKKIFID